MEEESPGCSLVGKLSSLERIDREGAPLLFAFPVCYLISNLLFVCDSFKKGTIRSYWLYSRKGLSFMD